MNANSHSDDKVLEDLFADAATAFPPPEGLKQKILAQVSVPARVRTGNIRRLVKYLAPAAAACLVLAALVGLWPRGPLMQSAYADLMAAIEKTQTVEWVHIRQTERQANGLQTKGTESWVSFSPMRWIVRGDNGNVSYVDYGHNRRYVYDPKTRQVTIRDVDILSEGDRARNMMEFMKARLEYARKQGAKITKAPGQLKGQAVDIYSSRRDVVSRTMAENPKTGEHEPKPRKTWVDQTLFYVDPGTQRVVRVEITEKEGGATRSMDLDYPKTGPADIYALGVPRDAKVVDERKIDEQGWRMLCEAEEAKARFPKRLYAIVYTGDVGQDGLVRRRRLLVYYQKEGTRRNDTYSQWRQGKNLVGGIGLDSLDGENLAEIERWIADRTPARVDMTDGGKGIYYKLTYHDEIRKHIELGQPGRFTGRLWAGSREYGKGLPPSEGPHGQLVASQRLSFSEVHRGKASAKVWRRTTLYVNPARDYIAERLVVETAGGDEPWVPAADREALKAFQAMDDPHIGAPGKKTTTVLEYAQTPVGHWYPRKRLIEAETSGGKVTRTVQIIHLDTTREIPDDVFDWRKFEATLQRPIKQW